MDNKVELYFKGLKQWKNELNDLRALLLNKELDESLKWGRPCYSRNGKLIIGLSGFKNHYGMWFFHGVYLKDKKGVLINAQDGKTAALRQMRFDSDSKIDLKLVDRYIDEAIQNADEGKFYKAQKKELVIPDLLEDTLASKKDLQKLFDALSLSKKREFAEYISKAKREATKLSRLEKIIPMIEQGIGLHDKYR